MADVGVGRGFEELVNRECIKWIVGATSVNPSEVWHSELPESRRARCVRVKAHDAERSCS